MVRFGLAHLTFAMALMMTIVAACHPTHARNSGAQPTPPITHLQPGPVLTQLRNSPLLIASAVAAAASPQLTFAVMFASWCGHCHVQLDLLNRLRLAHPTVNFIGLSYAPFEQFNANGDLARLRTYAAAYAPWLPIYALPQSLFQRVGRPSKVPTLWVFSADGALVATFDRAVRSAPEFEELEALVAAAQPAIQ